jgi:hypothetical protein
MSLIFRLHICVMLLFLSWTGTAQTGKTWLERDAEIYASAWANKDASTVILYTHPKYLEVYGNYEYRLRYIFDRTYGTVTDARIEVVNTGFSAGQDFLSIVVMHLTYEDQYYRYYKQIPLVGASVLGGQGYSFIQPTDMTDTELTKVFPAFRRNQLPNVVAERTEQKAP